MYKSITSFALMAPFLAACGASFPAPTQRLADAQSAERSALELGANNEPVAQLSMKLAQEQIALAKKAIADGENKRADGLLIRAKADAELAIAQAREKNAKIEVQKAVDDSAAQKATNVGQGAVK
jgi:PBP1b-binding outer membrane lipoprotein LpoB